MANDVVTGKDGWLFFVGDRTLDHYFGVARFNPGGTSRPGANSWSSGVIGIAKRGVKVPVCHRAGQAFNLPRVPA